MKIYLGLLASSLPSQTRIFGEVDGHLVDLNLAYTAYLTQAEGNPSIAYELAAFFLPETISAFLERGAQARKALDEAVAFTRRRGLRDIRGPAGERIIYDPKEVRILPPLQNPQKSFVIGFSDRARIEAMPKAEIPTGYYKLPQ